MTIFNRILLIVISLLTLSTGIVTLLLLNGIFQPANVALNNILSLYMLWRGIAQLRGADANSLTLVALFMTIIGLVLLALETITLFTRRETVRYVVQQDDLGTVTVERSMVRDMARHEAEAVPGVMHAETNVADVAQGLRISTRAALSWDAVVPTVGKELQARIQDAVQSRLGLSVAEVRVVTHVTPLPKQTQRHVA